MLTDKFVFRPVLTVLSLIGLLVLCSLGIWQLKRLQWKEDLIAQVEARRSTSPIDLADLILDRDKLLDSDNAYTPVLATGTFIHDLEAHVFGTLDAVAGYYVFTPLKLKEALPEGAAYVYVNRGFVPQDKKSPGSRPDGDIAGRVTVEGLFRLPEREGGLADVFRAPNDIDGNVWHERRPRSFRNVADIETADFYIDSLGKENTGVWPKGGTTRIEFSNRHREYAFTWFGLAATLIVVFALFSRRT
ncbi:MAG: SURF1 family protein [Pseudomonadota bacterium]